MSMNILEILQTIVKENASDIFIVAGRPLTYKVNGNMKNYSEDRMLPDHCREFITELYKLAGNRDISSFADSGDDDFSVSITGLSRLRVSTYKQRGSYSAVIRVIPFNLPKPEDLSIPDSIMELANTNKGLVLVTGPAGGGKSTTLACQINKINEEQDSHIITLDDP